jgi:hypothetical protein
LRQNLEDDGYGAAPALPPPFQPSVSDRSFLLAIVVVFVVFVSGKGSLPLPLAVYRRNFRRSQPNSPFLLPGFSFLREDEEEEVIPDAPARRDGVLSEAAAV